MDDCSSINADIISVRQKVAKLNGMLRIIQDLFQRCFALLIVSFQTGDPPKP